MASFFSPAHREYIAGIALAAFRARWTNAWAAVDAGRIKEEEVQRHTRPWAAIALLAGADAGAIHPDLPELLAQRFNTPGGARWLLADDLCPRRHWLPLLAKARDKAMATVNDPASPAERKDAAHRTLALAAHLSFDINGLHLPPYVAPDAAAERKAT
jgi:hypothetical protein